MLLKPKLVNGKIVKGPPCPICGHSWHRNREVRAAHTGGLTVKESRALRSLMEGKEEQS